MKTELIKPDYLFEVSWEVCNKVGGIYTVIATKSLYLKSEYNRHHIMVGPDVWMDTEINPDFIIQLVRCTHPDVFSAILPCLCTYSAITEYCRDPFGSRTA